MRKFLIRLISLILLIAMLLPMAAACSDDPPPPSNEGENGENENQNPTEPSIYPTSYVDAVQTGWNTTTVWDVDSDAVISANNQYYAGKIAQKDGLSYYKWVPSEKSLDIISLPDSVVINGNRYVEFSIYTDQATVTEMKLYLHRDVKSSVVTIKVTHTGKHDYRILMDSFGVTKPTPDVTNITLEYVSGNNNTAIYVSDIKVANPVYELKASTGIDITDAALYEPIIQSYKQYSIGNGNGFDNTEYTKLLDTIVTDASNSWSLFKSTKSGINESDTLFNVLVTNQPESGWGTPFKNGSKISEYYKHVVNMAKGYALEREGNPNYQNPELLADIKACLEYGYDFYYGAHIVETGKTYGNWYCWVITIPDYVNTILIMIKEHLTDAEISKYLAPHKIVMYWPDGDGSNRMNMAKVVLVAAALDKDALRLASTNKLIEDVFYYQDKLPADMPDSLTNGGVYTDGSYIQHENIPYTGSYGNGFLYAVTQYAFLLKDCVFGLYFEAAENQYLWALNNYRPVIFGANLSASLLGRSVTTATEGFTAMESIRSAMIMSTYAPDEYKAELLQFVKTVMVEANSMFLRYMPLQFMELAYSIYSDASILPQTDYLVGKVFGYMDRVAQHNDGYGVMIALSSTRMAKYESINDANETGWYQGDGMIYIYTDNFDYGQWAYNYYACPYLMPGTTVNMGLRDDTPVTPPPMNSSPYAGGVEQGKYAIAGFILGYDRNDFIVSGGHERFESIECMDITAKKSYFMFDNEIVCIGSAIKDYSGKEVVTVVENRTWGLHKGVAYDDKFYINGAEVNPELVDTADDKEAPNAPQTEINARTMWFSNMGGYVFLRYNKNDPDTTTDLDGNTVKYQKARRYAYESSNGNPEDSNDFLEVTISHGTGDGNLDGKYAYVYLPEATVEETESYYENPDVIMIKRNGRGHAVLEKTLGIVAGVFFEHNVKDTIEVQQEFAQYTAVTNIEANTECAIMVSKGENGQYHVSVSDPTQTNGSLIIKVAITGITEVVSTEIGVTASVLGGVVTLNVNTQNAHGATFDVTVK